jgi:hypothetical protein
MIGTGIAFQLYQNIFDAIREDLYRKRLLFVQQRQARYLDTPQKETEYHKKLYEQIVKDLEATGYDVKSLANEKQ